MTELTFLKKAFLTSSTCLLLYQINPPHNIKSWIECLTTWLAIIYKHEVIMNNYPNLSNLVTYHIAMDFHRQGSDSLCIGPGRRVPSTRWRRSHGKAEPPQSHGWREGQGFRGRASDAWHSWRIEPCVSKNYCSDIFWYSTLTLKFVSTVFTIAVSKNVFGSQPILFVLCHGPSLPCSNFFFAFSISNNMTSTLKLLRRCDAVICLNI